MLRNELHESVLKTEVIKALSIKPDGVYIDATFDSECPPLPKVASM